MLLRAAGFAPLAVLGTTLSSGERGTIASIVGDAGLPPQARAKLRQVAATLFTYLKKGAGPVEVLTPEVIAKAYEMSGPYVIRNLSAWPQDGNDPDTNSCANLCGYRTRLLAEARGASEATADEFVEAWIETRDRQAEVMSRARNAYREAPDGDASTRLGGGC